MSSPSLDVLWANGRFCSGEEPALSALDRGFTLGDGLFETMRADRSRIFRLSQHLARLRRGAAVLEMPLPDEEDLLGVLQKVLDRAGGTQAVVRLTVSRGVDQGRGVGLPIHPQPSLVVRASPLVRPPSEAYQTGYRAIIASLRRNETSPLSRIKSLNYLDSVLARREASLRGCDEAVMLNTRGQVACGSVANLFAVKDNVLWTAPEEAGALPGITRECLLELAALLQLRAQVAPFGLDLLLGADEAFLSNTIVGVMPLTQVEGQAIGRARPGPVTTGLAEAYKGALEAS